MKSWLMNKNAKIALLLLIGALLAFGAIVVFLKDSRSPRDAAVGSVAPGPSGSVETVKDLPRRKTYPIGKWDVAIPYLNPFGSQDNYQSVDYTPNQTQEFKYVDDENMETSRITGGDLWELQVQWKDAQADPWEDLRLYVTELGGKFYMGASEDNWVLRADDPEGTVWWAAAAKNGEGYLMKVYRELRLKHGPSVAFQTSAYPNQEIYFMTSNEQHKYQSLKVDLAEGQVRLAGKGVYSQGQYRRDMAYNQELYAYKTKHYTLDDIPQSTSAPLLWKLTWSPDSDPQEIVLTLEESEDIRPVKDGERLGALKVRGDALGLITVEAPPGVTLTHPELHLKGDKTPEGDTLFWLPSGFWNVVVEPDNRTPLNTRLVPVSSGEMTELEIKPLLQSAYRNDGIGDASGEESKVKIEEAVELGDQARLTFMLLDSQNPKFTPAMKDIDIVEGGKSGTPVKLNRIATPPSVVLALDSSGSMSKSMEQVLESARAFIQRLPDNAHIQVIDFDSEIRVLEGSSKKEVLANLDQIKAKGNTKLYDSVVEGLTLLKGKQRPTLVVFTDGVDSNTEKAGTGSKASKSEVEQAVKSSGIPIYSIGFGPDHDNSTLLELAGMSEGTYYSAQDAAALNHVFAAINDRLGNRFELTYERPKEQSPSDVPVIAMTLDVSGSMDVDPASGNGDYRIDKVKHLFHDFIRQLPDNSLMQLLSFSTELKFDQVFTSRKSELLQALGNLKAGGGTEILSSVFETYHSLKQIPSEKRVIVYVTDAALDVEESKKAFFEEMLNGIKKEGIQVLWVGLGTSGSEEAFKWAAEKSGGNYVISEDPVVLAKAFQEALVEVQKRPSKQIPLMLSVRNESDDGLARMYAADRLVDFPVLVDAGDKVEFQTIGFETGKKVAQYEQATAALVYGRDLPSEEVKIYKRLPLNSQGKNKAVEWTARELLLLKKLKGVDAPANRSFAAIEMELTNIHPDGADYLIPNFASHFFMNVNGAGTYPASTATWLTEQPLAAPGQGDVTVKKGETVRGMLVFIVPNEKMERASVHYYDIEHGHISLALAGSLPKEDPDALAGMPTSATGKLSDTFELVLTAVGETDHIEKVALTRKTSMFKIVETRLMSLVQADLKLNPHERFYLNVKTAKGPFLIPVHMATALLPHGLLRPVLFGPGSSNKARLAFQTPNALAAMPTELYVDLFGGATVLPVSGGGSTGENGSMEGLSQGGAAKAIQGKGVSLTVNSLSRIRDMESGSGNFVIADITVADESDGFGSSGFRETFKLAPVQAPAGREAAELQADPITDGLLLGVNKDWAVFDGASRRGLLVFSIPNNQTDLNWTLQSDLFAGLNLPVGSETYKEDDLLVKRVEPPLDEKFDIQLSAALTEAISRHRSLEAAKSSANAVRTADFDPGQGRKEGIPAPLPIVRGMLQLEAVKTWSDFQALVEGLRWLPSADLYSIYRSAPEAVLTQGWGTEGDLANLTGGLLAKLGYSPALRVVQVTDRGRTALEELGSVDAVTLKQLPAWSYSDEQGQTKIFVVPFMKDLSELDGLAFFPGGQESKRMTSAQSTISVYFKAEAKKDRGVGGIVGDIGGALGGGGGDERPLIEEVRVLEAVLNLDQLSREPVDVRAGGSGGKFTAVLESQTLQIVGNRLIDTNEQKIVGVRIEVQLPKKKLIHETQLKNGEEIADLFHTIAINLPDLPAEAAEELQQAAGRVHKATEKPDDRSALVWYTRSILYRIIASQTAYESELAEVLDVTAGRVDKERVVFVTVRNDRAQAKLRTSVDLQQIANRIHRGSEEAVHGFQIMSGLFASRLEGAALPGDKTDFMDVWQNSQANTSLFLSLANNRKEDLKYMEEHGFPDTLIERAKSSTAAMLIPNRPTSIQGENRWAWLEIDPDTYETISVTDTGEHGSFAEYLMALEPVSPTGDDYMAFMAGAFIGVSSSVWSVSSFSLMLDDYEQILKAAKAYTYGLGEVLSGFMSNKDLPKLEYSIGSLKLKITDFDADKLAKQFHILKSGKAVEGAGDLVGFGLGFQIGAAYYFEQAEKAIQKPTVKNGPPSGGASK
ncbi:VWA domain-containing protein [Cohnella sp. LGH]|uniref:vWA domain-containing protein n=1 Tax=Cohnella sp. LGH TaxID=1619153 RepID=UPI001ADA3BF1|nr:VWA domain-containing protein [Cohnella sp. LGH]QTH43478.1 VWA domain-containing protein [Cohnella sp. LGH]